MATTWTAYFYDPQGNPKTFRGLTYDEQLALSLQLQRQGWTTISSVQEGPGDQAAQADPDQQMAQELAATKQAMQATQPMTVLNKDGSQTVVTNPNQLAQALSSGALPVNQDMTQFRAVGANSSGYTVDGQNLAQALGAPDTTAAQRAMTSRPGVFGPPVATPQVSTATLGENHTNGTVGLIGEDQAGVTPPNPGTPGVMGPDPVTAPPPAPVVQPLQQASAPATTQQPATTATQQNNAYHTDLSNPTNVPNQVPADFDQLLNSLQNQIQGRLQRSDDITNRAMELSDFLRDQFTNNAVMRDQLVSRLLDGTGTAGPGSAQLLQNMLAKADTAEGLSPEALSALRSQATAQIPGQFNQAAEQLRTDLLRRGVTGGTQPTAAGPYIERLGPLLAARDSAVAQANQNTILANEQYKRDSLNQNRANALNASGQMNNLISAFGNIYNPVPYAQGALSGFNTTIAANQVPNQLLGTSAQLAGVQGEAQPSSYKNMLLSALLATGGKAALDLLKNSLSNNTQQTTGSGSKLNFNVNLNDLFGGYSGYGGNGGIDWWNDPFGGLGT